MRLEKFKPPVRSLPPIILGLFLFMISCSSSTEPPLSPRFNHVYLTVDNLEESIAFYTQAFDLKVIDKVAQLKLTQPNGTVNEVDVNMAFLSFPNQNFILEIGERSGFKPNNDSPSYAHIGVDVLDIEAAHKRLLAAGATLTSPIKLVEANDIKAKNSFYSGPDGETIELMQVLEGKF